MTAWLAFAAVVALSAALVGVTRRRALRDGVLDLPGSRSSHSRPTPRGGGVGMLQAIALMLPLTTGLWPVPADVALAMLGVVATAAVGAVDDVRSLRPALRLGVHLLTAVLLLPLALTLSQGAFGVALMVGWWVFFTVSSVNVVNFMDGIDGFIGAQAALFGLHLVLGSGDGPWSRGLGVLLSGASLGFLLWNWAPAKIFLGDAGSGGLGALFVVGGTLLMREGAYSLIAAFLPLAPIFLDASVTLVQRIRRGERLSEAHRSHLYQQLANGGLGHPRTSLLFAAASAVGVLAAWAMPRMGLGPLALYLSLCAVVGRLTLRRVTTSARVRLT